jgi:hypothetical protein
MMKVPTINGEQTLNLEEKTIEVTKDCATLDATGRSIVGVSEQTTWSAADAVNFVAANIMFDAESFMGQHGKLSSQDVDIHPFCSYLQLNNTTASAQLNVIYDNIADGMIALRHQKTLP